jgi:hypothetical protein
MIEPFPANCPPDDAVPMDGTFYSLAEANLVVGGITGRMSWQRPYERKNGDYMGRADLVEAHALSVFAVRGDLDRARGLVPWMAKKSVAEVTITSSDGHLINTPTSEGASHHDWWTTPHTLVPEAVVVEAKRVAS